MRLAIGGPTRDTVPAAFAVDVAQLYAYTKERGPWHTVTIGFLASTYIHVGRELFLEAALKQGATHVLWLDTDMTFPRETAVLLEMRDQAMVGCNYTVRQPSGLFTAQHDDGTRIPTTSTSTGLETVHAIGFGVLLMRTDIMPGLTRPWFRHGMNEAGGDVGEDIMCCRKIRQGGHQIFIDHDLSKQVGHIGQHTYRIQAEAVPA